MPKRSTSRKSGDLIAEAQNSVSSGNATAKNNQLYTLCTEISPPVGGWFSLIDCFGRAIRSVVAFYYLMITHPISFLIFTCRYNHLWYGGWAGVVLTLCLYPIWPVAVFVMRVLLKVKNYFFFKPSFDNGNVFFIAPDNPIGSIMWDFYKEFSVYTSLYIMCGNDQTAINHSWYDHITQKKFWRDNLSSCGAHVPQKLADWNGVCSWCTDGASTEVVGDVVIKLPDSYLGIGDLFLEVGVDGFNGTRIEIENILKEKYSVGQDGTFILEWVRPAKGHEVHSLDILTVAGHNGVELASCLYWGKCADGKSTHSSKAGYVCDVLNEKILAPASWYSAYFEKEMGGETAADNVPHGCGTNLPGLRAICANAVRTHEQVLEEQPWLKMCGWDVLIAKNGPTFFEGNFAAHRIPRRVFLTCSNMFYFLSTYRGPFSC